MLIIITAAVIILSTIGISSFFIFINKRNDRKRIKSLLDLFHKAGSDLELSFSSQEVLKNKIIGLDGLNKSLLVFEFGNIDTIININLTEVKNCILKKEYENINFGNEKKSDIERHLRSIDLQFILKNGSDSISISFYDSNVNTIYELSELEAKAKDWEAVLFKMINREVQARA